MRANYNKKRKSRNADYRKDSNKSEVKGSKLRNLQPDSGSRMKENSFEKESHHAYNDVKWYIPNQEILNSAASISFENAAGDNIFIGDHRIPGIYVADMALSYGVSADSTSPLNIAARESYSRLMTGITSYAPFEANDYMMYLLAMDSIYNMYNSIKRAYGIFRHYEYKNRYTPTAILQAMGIDAGSFSSNLSDVWFSLNYWSSQISKFAVPQVMSIFMRHSWLASNVYKDGENDKSQLYIFNPRVIYRYDVSQEDPTGKLVAIESGFASGNYVASKSTTWSTLKNTMNQLLDSVNTVQDFDVISAYVLKKYENNLYTLGATPSDYEIAPVYDKTVLLQIHNATVFNISAISTFNITQELSVKAATAYLLTTPKSTTTQTFQGDYYLDLMDVEAEPNVIMEATRLMCTVDNEGDVAGAFTSMGGDVIISHNVFTYYRDGKLSTFNLGNSFTFYPNTTVSGTKLWSYDDVKKYSILSKFHYVPMFYFGLNVDESGSVASVTAAYGDLGNYTVLSSGNIVRLNNVAMMGLLGLIE